MLGSRRHRPPNPPLTAATANPNATMAAAAVFNKGREQQQPSLSAAAAAAALRARPQTPTNVAEVQTKRTRRRSASVSSSGTAPDARGRPGLERRGSSGSMTERTFRSPSPGPRRPASSGGDGPVQEAPPPVPALPKSVQTGRVRLGPGDSLRHRKTQSLVMSSPPFRVASQKLSDSAAPSWFRGAHVGDLSNVRTSDVAMASPPLSPPPPAQPGDDERPDSRNSSINFSYPSRIRVGSPVSRTAPASFELPRSPPPLERGSKRTALGSSSVRNRPLSTSSVQSMVYDPNSRRMVPREEIYPPEQDARSTSGRSMSFRKKKKQAPKSGAHLAQGTMGRTKVAPAATVHENVQEPPSIPVGSESERVPQTDTRRETKMEQSVAKPHNKVEPQYALLDEPAVTVPPKENAPASETSRMPFTTHAAQQQAPSRNSQQPQPQSIDEESAVKSLTSSPRSEAKRPGPQRSREAPPQTNLPEADRTENVPSREFTWIGQGVRRQPSVVKEEPEPEDEQAQSPRGDGVLDALDAVPTRQKVYEPAPQLDTQLRHRSATAQPAALNNPELPPTEVSPVAEAKQVHYQPRTGSIQRDRSQSNSPARTARFGTVQDSLAVKHSPPPRSVSPRKSALKQTSPSRGASPDGGSNISEASSSLREEPAVHRKKSVRVSFDEGNTVVLGGATPTPDAGESPTIPSPQHTNRRPWYSNIGRDKKQEFVPLDDDEIMKPRPVLPSFGSVRDKKPRETPAGYEERPLVRPVMESANSPSIPGTPAMGPVMPHTSDDEKPETTANTPGSTSESWTAASQAESDQRAKIAANTSRFREPLPPVVTSIEGNGYLSDTSSSSEEEDRASVSDTLPGGDKEHIMPQAYPEDVVQRQEGTRAVPLVPTEQRDPEAVPSGVDSRAVSTVDAGKTKVVETDIPTVAISQPTPPPEKASPRRFFLVVPGGFPEDDSELSSQGLDDRLAGSNTATPMRQVTFEPVSQSEDAIQTPHTPATIAATVATTFAPVGEGDDDTGSSIYSDAADHFTDTENEGFLSLDAVVERSLGPSTADHVNFEPQSSQGTPAGHGSAGTTAAGLAPSAPLGQDLPAHLGTELSTATTAVETRSADPAQPDWERVKIFWRSLNAEKRAQLEREAMEDAGVEGDLEGGNQEKKSKKKKSVERRNSERKAMALHNAQQMMASGQQGQTEEIAPKLAKSPPPTKPINSDPTYMIKPGTKVGADPIVPHKTEQRTRSTMKTSDSTPRMRTSMRTNGFVSKTSEPAQPRRTALEGKTLRPASWSQPVSSPKVTKSLQRVSSPPVATPTAMNSFFPSPVKRRGSTSSESSFRRSRPEPNQVFGFRKTLRQPSPSQNETAGKGPSSRFSLRLLSPTGSPVGHSSPPVSMGMKQTLRGTATESKSSGGLHLGGFGKGSGKKSKGPSSRFDDSSGDKGALTLGQKFRSRFADPSDEDDVRPHRSPPTSSPKTMRSSQKDDSKAIDWSKPIARKHPPPEESPALPEEKEEEEEEEAYLDEEKQASGPLSHRKSARSGRGDFVASPTAATTSVTITGPQTDVKSSRRGSFMSVLRRKKNKASGIARPERMDSAARRDTKLERSTDQLKDIRQSMDRDEDDGAVVRPRSPRLQKRTASFPLDAVMGGNWPLSWPGPQRGGEKDPMEDGVVDGEKTDGLELRRPSTSGNLGTRTLSGGSFGSRPAFMQRRTVSSNFVGVEGSALGTGEKKKKKKFGSLRKMFGLND